MRVLVVLCVLVALTATSASGDQGNGENWWDWDSWWGNGDALQNEDDLDGDDKDDDDDWKGDGDSGVDGYELYPTSHYWPGPWHNSPAPSWASRPGLLHGGDTFHNAAMPPSPEPGAYRDDEKKPMRDMGNMDEMKMRGKKSRKRNGWKHHSWHDHDDLPRWAIVVLSVSGFLIIAIPTAIFVTLYCRKHRLAGDLERKNQALKAEILESHLQSCPVKVPI